jgi:uncharacterized RDD family membrane protein YckC
MKSTHIRWLLVGLLVFWLILNLTFSNPRTLGVSAEWTDTQYRFAGGTGPADLCFAVLLIGMYVLLINTKPEQTEKPVRGILRRFVAFWLDFMVAVIAVGPLLGIVPTMIEWRRTGEFQWTFERASYARGDSLQLWLLTAAMVVALVFYHAIPVLRKRSSPGACMMGYRVVCDDETALNLKNAILRTLLGFIAIAAWCITPFIGRDRQRGKIWIDKVFSTRAVMLG